MVDMTPVAAFFASVGALCGLGTFLAILMVIADATIANYGEVKVTINSTKVVETQGGRSLLATLMAEKIFIPSACGGKGSCGYCKVKVTSDVGEILPTELPWLTDEEQASNIRLSCQLKVKQDIEIEIPEELFNVREYRGVVVSLVDLTYDIKQVTLRLVDPTEISFTPGQYVQFQVPEYELADESVYRAYSVSSPASDTTHVQLEIRLVPNGICTTYVHQHLKEGDEVILNGPYGEFRLSDTNSDIVFIAGGSGMAPIKSMLHQMAAEQNPRRARYFFGARGTRDIFLRDEMRDLEGAVPDFRFIPALSEPPAGDEWDGEVGLITEVVDRHVSSGENVEAYLCGSPGMIDACVKVLTAKGVPETLIYYDKFS